MDWSQDLLWNKAIVYMGRAQECERDSALFPFWATLSLEFLARSSLAKIHPSLLAEPDGGPNILYACGVNLPENTVPKSVGVKTVFSRCKAAIEDFTSDDETFCMSLINRRNIELHSGQAAFEDFKTRLWLPQFYAVTNTLSTFQNKTLDDFLGIDEAKAARRVLSEKLERLERHVKEKIAINKDRFYHLPKDEQDRLRKENQSNVTSFTHTSGMHFKKEQCPACKSDAYLGGEVVRSSDPYLSDDEVVTEIVVLPSRFICKSCNLQLTSFGEVHGAGLGDQFSEKVEHDPIEFFSINPMDYVEPEDFFEPDYGND